MKVRLAELKAGQRISVHVEHNGFSQVCGVAEDWTESSLRLRTSNKQLRFIPWKHVREMHRCLTLMGRVFRPMTLPEEYKWCEGHGLPEDSLICDEPGVDSMLFVTERDLVEEFQVDEKGMPRRHRWWKVEPWREA